MKCPVEQSELIRHAGSGVAFHYCGQCHGLFLNREELMACLRGGSVAAGQSGPPAQSYDVTQMIVKRHCPSCESASMVDKILDDVAIDICPDCKGVWFDAGELDKLLARRRKQQGGTAVAKDEGAGQAGLDAWTVDLAGDAVCSFLVDSGSWLESIGSSLAEFFTIDF